MNTEFHLTPQEKARLREALRTYMRMRPAGAPAETRTAYAWVFSMRPLPAGRQGVALLLVIALFGSSAGISYAAQSALPGDALYAVKTKVNEPVAGALAVGTQAKVKWAAQVAQARVQEAATLVAEGRLDEEAQQALKENFDAHARLAANLVADEAESDPETGMANAVALEAELQESERVLAQVGEAKGIPTATLASAIQSSRERTGAIRQVVQERLAIAAATRPGTSPALALRDAAKQKLEDSQTLALSASAALDASSANEVEAQLTGVKEALAEGEERLGENDNAQAQASFAQALSATQKLGVFLRTSAAIHSRTGMKIADARATRIEKGAAPAPAPAMMQTTSFSATMAAPAPTTSTSSELQAQEAATLDVHADADDQHEDDNDSHTLRISVPDLFGR